MHAIDQRSIRLRTVGRHGGFSLLEVLIAVAIFGLGLLGLAQLQTVGLRYNHDAYLRSQATVLSYDVIDRMRANRIAIEADHYDLATPEKQIDCLAAVGCDAQQMAKHDMLEWNNSVAGLLPGGRGIVCIDSTPADGTPTAPACDGASTLYAVKIWWDADRSGTPDQRYVLSYSP